jgi:hypothetical protein
VKTPRNSPLFSSALLPALLVVASHCDSSSDDLPGRTPITAPSTSETPTSTETTPTTMTTVLTPTAPTAPPSAPDSTASPKPTGDTPPANDPSRSPPPPGQCATATGLRQVAPVSGMTVTSAQPRLRWTGGGAVDIQICSDPACAQVVAAFMGTPGHEATPPAPLAPGYYFWRLKANGAQTFSSPPWEFRVRRHVEGYTPTANTAAEPFADYDGDGYPDVIIYASNISMYRGGPGGPSPDRVRQIPGTSEYTAAIVPPGADLDGDGITDTMTVEHVQVPNANASVVGHVIFGVRDGQPTRPSKTVTIIENYPLPNQLPAGIGDFDGDGVGDLGIGLRYGGATIKGCPGGPPDRAWMTLTCEACRQKQFLVGDFDGDGKSDFAFGDSESLFVYRDGRDPVPLRQILFGAVADLNGDAYSDLLAQPLDASNSPQRFNGGPQGVSAAGPAPAAAVDIVTTGDFNNDGIFDLVAKSCTSTCSLTVAYGTADGGYERATVFPQTGRVLDVATVDLDADGFDDLLVTQDPRGATYYRGGPVGLSATATTTLAL